MVISENVQYFLKKNILLSPDLLNLIQQKEQTEGIFSEQELQKLEKENFLVLDEHVLSLKKPNSGLDWMDYENARAEAEKKGIPFLYKPFGEIGAVQKLQNLKIEFSYAEKSKKRSFTDFVNFFNARFNALEKILKQRQELQNTTSIKRLLSKKNKENVSIIGLVYDKAVSKNGNFILIIEDNTGFVKVIINKSKQDLYELGRDVCLDEMIGITGVYDDKVVFVNELFFPDVSLDKEFKKGPEENYVVFIGDPHFGSSFFLDGAFEKFLMWLQGDLGTETQRDIAKKVKYLFIVGDLVEGVGIYPGQEKELRIADIYEQYSELVKYLKKIPSHISVIICPGNHDAGRMSEPQPPIYRDFAGELWELPNFFIVSNPAIINIDSSADFPGFDVLLYHGGSLVYYSENLESIRSKGGQKRPDLLMKYLLQRRHLAPTHASTLYVPDPKRDPLVINKVPDFFVTGHIHRTSVSTYRNVTLLNCSCWVPISENQEKRGLEPQPGRVLVANLKTREVKILNFYTEEGASKDADKSEGANK